MRAAITALLLALPFASVSSASTRFAAAPFPSLATAGISPASAAANPQQPSGGNSRERSGLAEDQALLQRQLSRLKQTMEILAARFEAEGRAHAAKLLREGLSHLGERGQEQEAKTLDELMGGSKSSLESGQTMQAIDTQEAVVKSLEKLYAILTDRQGLDDLDKSLDELRKIKADLTGLANREKDLKEKTSALGEKSASPQAKELAEGIRKAIEAQRNLLAATETQARESGEMEIESIARELEALAKRQATDTAVLETWQPGERSPLESAVPDVHESEEHASVAQRLAQAARELRAASSTARDPKGDVGSAARGLESSADREERRERAAAGGDEAKTAPEAKSARASSALRTGAKALSDAPPTPDGRSSAAKTLDDQAAALEKAAEEELAAARAKREAASAALARMAAAKSPAAEVAQRARTALDPRAEDAGSKSADSSGSNGAPNGASKANPGDASPEANGGSKIGAKSDSQGQDSGKSLEERADEARRASAEAGRALTSGLEEQSMLPKALAASQGRASEESARLERALSGVPEGASDAGAEARRALTAASESQANAAKDASEGRAADAAAAAQAAREKLDAARAAIAKAREKGSGARPESDEEKALAKQQEELARSLEDLEAKAAQASPQDSAQSSGSQNAGSQSSSSQGSQSPSASSQRPSASSQSSGANPQPSASSQSAAAKSSLSNAKNAMQSAAKSLASGSPTSASKSQREALSELEKAAERAGSNGPLSKPEDKAEAEALAKEQERIRQELLDLAKRNQKRDASRPTPSLGKAGSSASKAQNDLEQGDMDQAEENESDAEREMRQALSSLSEEEEQYQKLRAEELLFKVAEQVKALQDAHREAMRETKEIDGARAGSENATHTQRLRLRKVSKSEEGLAARAADMEKAIRAEESLVFAEVLDRVDRDLVRVAKDLGDEGGFQSGDRVQAIQQDVDQGLAWLHQALQAEKDRRRQEESEQQSGQGQGSKERGRNRLVADAAELKLLRQLEVENLDALDKFKAAHPELTDPSTAQGDVDPRLLEDLSRLADRHSRTSDLFEKFRKRLGLPDPGSQEP